MIKARGITATGAPLLLLGLSAVNVQRLQEGRPIHITQDQLVAMGLPGAFDVVLMAGDTEASISASLGGMPLQPEVEGQVFTTRREP